MEKPAWEWNEADLVSGRLITPKCPECGGTGRLTVVVFKAEREEDCGCRWRAESYLREAHFPDRFAGNTLADLQWGRFSPALVAGVQSFAELLEAYGAEGIGVVLVGNVGNGKTHIAVGFGKLACGLGYSAAFVTLADTLEDLRSTYSQAHSQAQADNPLAVLLDVDWLILDDLGIESDSPWVREKVYQLVNRRWLARKPMIVTTNKSPEELTRRYGEGVVSRLWGDSVVLHFQAEDFRLSAKAQRLARLKGNPRP